MAMVEMRVVTCVAPVQPEQFDHSNPARASSFLGLRRVKHPPSNFKSATGEKQITGSSCPHILLGLGLSAQYICPPILDQDKRYIRLCRFGEKQRHTKDDVGIDNESEMRADYYTL